MTRVLAFTLPALLLNGQPLDRLDAWAAYTHTQSQTWRDSSASMLADPAAWARLWPRVRSEATPVQVASRGVTLAAAGTRDSCSVADTSAVRPVFFYVVTKKNTTYGIVTSAPSNEIGRP